ncbi:unnamed protein product [Dibothriocephalus latus]|uniref:Uncharacterized protein n=1 Tax=Dibothriocephalus latus TaxID=60516 RepID=A0A3P6UC46_DIBLA|nr:unnamed protein product [Dibothriocephalus latus]
MQRAENDFATVLAYTECCRTLVYAEAMTLLETGVGHQWNENNIYVVWRRSGLLSLRLSSELRDGSPKFGTGVILLSLSFAHAPVDKVVRVAIFSKRLPKILYFGNFVIWFIAMHLNTQIKRFLRNSATTIFEAAEDSKESQLVVIFLHKRKLHVRGDAVETPFDYERPNVFAHDKGIIHLLRPVFRWVMLEDQRL